MKYIRIITLLFVIIGGLNWLLIGVFKFNAIHAIFSKLTFIESTIYIIIGLAAIMSIPVLTAFCFKLPYNKD